MPELPEVETIKNELAPHIIGHKLTGMTLLWEGLLRQPSLAELRQRITGKQITGISRHGKYLVLSLGGDDLLVMHMKMTGSLLVGHNSMEAPKYTRAVIHLDNDTSIFFVDPRKFGAMWLTQDRNSVLNKLGPEPLEPGFTPQFLAGLLKNRTAPVKALILDQSLIAGIGNMYADEALFAAGIHPLRPGGSLSREEAERLTAAIKQVLRSAIRNKGASIVNYFRPSGETGTAHFEFKVAHGRRKTCHKCGTPIERITVRNRGSYFCPRCQPEL